MRPATPPRRVAVIVIAAVAVAAGCGPRVVSSPVGTMSSAEEEALLASAKWVGCTTIQRETTVPGAFAAVRICADTGARRFGQNTPPSGLGKPVARMVNLSQTHTERRWNLQPGMTYHIWLRRSPAGPTAWEIRGPGGSVATGPFMGCNHPQASADSASFGTCEDIRSAAATSRGRNDFSRASSIDGGDSKATHTLLHPATGPAWISCTEGCCTTDAALAPG